MSCIFRHTDNIPDITTTNDVYSEKNHCVRRFKLSLSHPRLLLLTLLKQSELLYSARRCRKPVLSLAAAKRAGSPQLLWLCCVSCRSYLWSSVELCLSSDPERAMSVKSGPGPSSSGGQGGGSFVGPGQCSPVLARQRESVHCGHTEPQ